LSDNRRRPEEKCGETRSPSRRSFTKTLAAAAIAAPVLAATASAQKPPPATAEPKAPPNPQPSPTQQQPQPPSPVAIAYAEVARARFGDQLSAEQFEAVKRGLDGNVRTADRLRAFKLKNSDEPDFVFGA
jgi:predicted pyridoxine 5'-phosphate oxidase superfamily flavin-nucleotide-binding protein